MTKPSTSDLEWKMELFNNREQFSLVIKKKPVQIQIAHSSSLSPINEELLFIQPFLAQP